MKKFFFRLETLLKVRRVREGRLARDLAIATQKMAQIMEKKGTLEQQIASLMEELIQKRQENDHSLQETYSQILAHLESSLDQATHNCEGQKKVVDDYKERLGRAVQERKVIEKIKEKQYSHWQTQTQQREDELLDELTISQSQKSS